MFQAPTVGRKLWFFQQGDGGKIPTDGVQPLDATVCYVNADGTVNLAIRDMYGNSGHTRLNVSLMQDGMSGKALGLNYWAEWMPYQKTQHDKAGAEAKALQPGVNVHGIGPDTAP